MVVFAGGRVVVREGLDVSVDRMVVRWDVDRRVADGVWEMTVVGMVCGTVVEGEGCDVWWVVGVGRGEDLESVAVLTVSVVLERDMDVDSGL